MIYFPAMHRNVEFKSSEGRRINDLPPDLRYAMEKFFEQIIHLPGEYSRITSPKSARKVQRPGKTVERIARLRYHFGITDVERLTVWTPQYIHTLDFAEEQGGRIGNGPYWAYNVWVRGRDRVFPIQGVAYYSRDTNLKWPTDLPPGLEPDRDRFSSRHNGLTHSPLGPQLHFRPRWFKK